MIGFQDESSPQTTANTVRLWSPMKPMAVKNTNKLRANLFGFYPLNGNPVIGAPMSSKKEDIAAFLSSVRAANGDRPIVMVLDNNPTHHARMVKDVADELDIRPAYPPPYSPVLTHIKFIWKSLKRVVPKLFFINREFLISELESRFNQEASEITYSEHWRSIFYQALL